MYSIIISPINKEKYSIHSSKGKSLLKKYIKSWKLGGAMEAATSSWSMTDSSGNKITTEETSNKIFFKRQNMKIEQIPTQCLRLQLTDSGNYYLYTINATSFVCSEYSGSELLHYVLTYAQQKQKSIELVDASSFPGTEEYSGGIGYIAFKFNKNQDYEGHSWYAKFGFIPKVLYAI